jgi:hypothetical protein
MVGFLLDILAGKFILTADERGLTRIKTKSETSYQGKAGTQDEDNVFSGLVLKSALIRANPR